ncbi:MAG: oxidoreductase [Bacteroidota bacterium]|nr:oxidoreductase [Bacteroidota bacterium]
MKQIVKVGLSAYGMSGKIFHAPFIQAIDGFEITHILERSKNQSAEDFPNATIVRSFEELIKSSVDLVIVNTPDYLHFPMAKAALEAGKHVVIEKPFTVYSSEAEELIKLAKEKNKILTVYQNRRLDNGFLTIQKILNKNLLGSIVEYEARFDRYKDHIPTESWKEKSQERNGLLFNLGSHLVDQALVLFGKPEAITAKLSQIRPGSQTDDYVHIRMDYSNMTVLLRASYLAREAGATYAIHGTQGSYVKYGIDPQEEQLKMGYKPNKADWGKDTEDNWGILNTTINGKPFREKIETEAGSYLAFYENLFNAVTQNEKLMVLPEESLEVIRILEAAIESNLLKKSILLPIKE